MPSISFHVLVQAVVSRAGIMATMMSGCVPVSVVRHGHNQGNRGMVVMVVAIMVLVPNVSGQSGAGSMMVKLRIGMHTGAQAQDKKAQNECSVSHNSPSLARFVAGLIPVKMSTGVVGLFLPQVLPFSVHVPMYCRIAGASVPRSPIVVMGMAIASVTGAARKRDKRNEDEERSVRHKSS